MDLWTKLARVLRDPRRGVEVLRDRTTGRRGTRHGLVGRPHLWKAKRQFQIDFLRAQGLEPHHQLLDLGCGTLRGGIVLIDYLDEAHYTGVEVRSEALAEGRKELAEAGLEHKRPRLVQCDDVSSLFLDQRFDYVWAFSVLIHMEDEILDACLGCVARHLDAEGVFLANVNVGEEGRPGAWQQFPVVQHPWEFYQTLARKHGFSIEDLGSLRELGDPERTRIEASARRMLRLRPQS
ncbi:MAG: class I SAM-dependent methyltransferase [Myxococcota bacterium]